MRYIENMGTIDLLSFYKYRQKEYRCLSFQEWIFAMTKVDKYIDEDIREFFFTEEGGEYFLGKEDDKT